MSSENWWKPGQTCFSPLRKAWNKHKSRKQGYCVKWKPTLTEDGYFVLREKERKHNSKHKNLVPSKKRKTPIQAQENETVLILFCLYWCLCFTVLSCLHHKFKDNFACVAGENYNPGQNERNNIDPPPPYTPKIKDGKMARFTATCLIFRGMKACCSILFCPVGFRSLLRDLTTPMRVRM